MKHRTWNHLRAEFGGYFWLPCPLCGQKFGGHEWLWRTHVAGIPTGKPGGSTAICPDCTRLGRGRHPVVPWGRIAQDGE